MASTTDEPASDRRLPLMRLPVEVRRGVYKHYFRSLFPLSQVFSSSRVICKTTVAGCRCLPSQIRPLAHKINIELAFTSKAIKNEVLAAFFETHTFHFTCGCELGEWQSTSQTDISADHPLQRITSRKTTVCVTISRGSRSTGQAPSPPRASSC